MMISRIDRRAVVTRHDVRNDHADAANPLTVGNGDFAFSVDITGMQTFTELHDPMAALMQGRLATNTATLSTWGWHLMPNPAGYQLTDAMSRYDTARGPVEYPDKYNAQSAMTGVVPEEFQAGAWLHANPHRLDLGRIGLVLRAAPDAEPETDPASLTNISQHLTLWQGTIQSSFEYLGETVSITTIADPDDSAVALRIASPLLTAGQLTVSLRFPYPCDSFFATADWNKPQRHTTTIRHHDVHSASITRELDDTTYVVDARWNSPGAIVEKAPHHLRADRHRSCVRCERAIRADARDTPTL